MRCSAMFEHLVVQLILLNLTFYWPVWFSIAPVDCGRLSVGVGRSIDADGFVGNFRWAGKLMQAESSDDVHRRVRMMTRLVHADGSALATCMLINLSATGARLKLANNEALPTHFVLLLSHSGQLCRHCAVESQQGADVTVRFVAKADGHALAGPQPTSA